MKKTVVAILVCAICVIAGGLGCGHKGGATLRPATGGKYYGGVFRINETGGLKSLDPVRNNDQTSEHIQLQIYDLLFDFDKDLNLIPQLATRYEVSPDGLTYTIYLRKGVYFQDDTCFPGGKGREFVASDVKYSYERVCDARTRTLGFDFFKDLVVGATDYFNATANGESTSGIPGFEVVNDTTFVIKLTQPCAPFIYHLTTGMMFIVPHEAVEYYKQDYFQHPVGTGPFRFVSWKPDVGVTLQRNPNYWQKDENGNALPYLDGVEFSFIQDEKTQFLEFKEGHLEECYRIPNEFFKDVVDSNKNPKGDMAKFVLQRTSALSTQYYGFLSTSPVFKDKRVRQAFAYAIDRDRIVKYVLYGQAYASATHGITPPGIPGYDISDIQGYTFNPEKARALIAAAGYPDGKGFPHIELELNAGGERNTQVAEAIQNMIKENLGIEIGLKIVEWAQHTTLVEEGKTPFFRLGWIADYPEPEDFLNILYGKLVPADTEPSTLNSVRYKNPQFDAIFEKAIQTTDQKERYALYKQAEQIAIADAPMIFIYNDEDYKFIQPYVRGYYINSMDRREFRSVWFDSTAYAAR
ncbi:MAG TPA: ABC transporter substrate-binding protein [Candidatus Kapabacteria bacterium]|nr:ABC transporter substrate-binding protein [Candidatus Kapabacteria bacterium]